MTLNINICSTKVADMFRPTSEIVENSSLLPGHNLLNYFLMKLKAAIQ